MQNKLSDQVVLEGKRAISNILLGGPGGETVFQGEVTIEKWSRALVESGARILPWTLGLVPVNLPFRAVYRANDRFVFLVEYPPGVRTMSWIREDSKTRWGEGTEYRDVTIALPYVLFCIATTWKGVLLPSSVYFRTQPLTKGDYSDELFDCHFLNCSVNFQGVYCWICSQHMRRVPEAGESLLAFVAATIENFWLSASNLSSEDNEGQSFFGKGSGGAHAVPDARVHTVQAWEKASSVDPRFVLDVPWNSAGRTVQEMFCELTKWDGSWPFKDSTRLGNIILSPPPKEVPHV